MTAVYVVLFLVAYFGIGAVLARIANRKGWLQGDGFMDDGTRPSTVLFIWPIIVASVLLFGFFCCISFVLDKLDDLLESKEEK